MTKWLGSLIQGAGALVLVAGLWLWDVSVALAVAGVLTIVFGVGLERRNAE